MFNTFKEKLKNTISKLSKKIENETLTEESTKADTIDEIKRDDLVEEIKEHADKGVGFFNKVKEKIITKKLSKEQFNELFWDLELLLLENNVAVEVVEKIKEDLSKTIIEKQLQRSKIEELIRDSLRNSIISLFDVEQINLLEKIKEKRPYVICFVGINGTGKTTSIAKVAYFLKQKNITTVISASDTFRAAAIKQLETHGERLGVKVIKHDYGSDPSAVAFDSRVFAKAKNIDVVLIDTAGRQHSNVNLMSELEKINRVVKPDLKIFVGESITGNDVVLQLNEFNKKIGIDAIILSKTDIDDRGGAMISATYVTKKPIIFLGCGQNYEDLKKFNKEELIKNLFE